jgi:acetyltransferase-like isoleucine patch superfamily enzyme
VKWFSRFCLFSYRTFARLRSKVFSLCVSGAFAEFGKGTVLTLPIRLSGEDRIAIGDDVFLGSDCWLQTLPDEGNRGMAISIGSGTKMSGACVISAARKVVLEEEVLLARNVYISDHIHQYSDTNTAVLAQGLDKIGAVLIKRGAWLGQNVVVCPGVTIGRGSVIGANSVVNRDIPDYCVAVGSPAQVVKRIGMAAAKHG